MFFRDDNNYPSYRRASLRRRLAGFRSPNSSLVASQVRILASVFSRNGFDVECKVVQPLPQYPSTHVIKVIWFNDDANEVSLDIHLNEDMIIDVACFTAPHINDRVAYDRPRLKSLTGMDVSGEILNSRAASELALACQLL